MEAQPSEPWTNSLSVLTAMTVERQEGNKPVHNQQIALVFKYKALLNFMATVCSHLQGVSVLKDIHSIIVQLVNNIW
jgi:hypothetical protein